MRPAAGPGPRRRGWAPTAAAAVRAVLRDRALTWAREIAADRVLGAEPDEALAAAAQRAFAALGGPLLIAWPELPVWRPVHGDGALDDLADGCDVAVGPIFDGGFYLLAFAEPLPALLEVPRSLDAMNRAFAAAHEAERRRSACCGPSAGCAAPPTSRRRWPIRCSMMSCGRCWS